MRVDYGPGEERDDSPRIRREPRHHPDDHVLVAQSPAPAGGLHRPRRRRSRRRCGAPAPWAAAGRWPRFSVRRLDCSLDRDGSRHCSTCRRAFRLPYHLSDDRRPRAARPGGAVVSGGCVSGSGGGGCGEKCPWWRRWGARPGSEVESAERPGMLSASQSSASGSEPQSNSGGSSRNAAAWVHNPGAL